MVIKRNDQVKSCLFEYDIAFPIDKDSSKDSSKRSANVKMESIFD